MTFEIREVNECNIAKYIELFKICYPKSKKIVTNDYFIWLYFKNPDGDVIGFDAFNDNELVGHYACIPTYINLKGNKVKGLLSLNTMTHPEFRNKGLFLNLAKKTYSLGEKLGYECIYGVSNKNSTYGFVNKLGFQFVCQLKANLFLKYKNSSEIREENNNNKMDFIRSWSSETLNWRLNNPSNKVKEILLRNKNIYLANTQLGSIIKVYAELESQNEENKKEIKQNFFLFIGLEANKKEGKIEVTLPSILKPAPLNFIYLPLNKSTNIINENKVNLNFLDFDAY
jgi:hypothetical protein